MTTQTTIFASQKIADTANVSLSGFVESSALTVEDSLSVGRRLASALDDLHAQDAVHGALCPSLIAVDDALTASIVPPSPAHSSANCIEALLYLSPEQLRGEPPTAASDQFSLGLIAHRLILGRNAFSADGIAESLFLAYYGILDQSADAFVDCTTQAVFDRVLSVNPAHRFASCLEFAEALDRIPRRSYSETRLLDSADSADLGVADSSAPETALARWSSRAWWLAAIACSLLAFALGLANWHMQNEIDSIGARMNQVAPNVAASTLRNGKFQVCNVSAEPLHVRELAAAYMDPSNQLRVFNSSEHAQDGWLIAPGQSSILSWRTGPDSDWDGDVLFYFLHIEGDGKESMMAGRWNGAASGCLHIRP